MSGEYYKFPLLIRDIDDKPLGDISKNSMGYILIFKIAPYDRKWICMGCQEAGNEWIGDDPQAHAHDHQMGLDFANKVLKMRPQK